MDDHEERAELSSEPVRSRWSPKPEQILILESIFNSGMVNPPKDETVRIRRMLEKFGSVGDANVFYWFQNRRSRSRRRQRQIQAAAAAAAAAAEEQPIHYANTETANNFSTSPIVSNYPMINTAGPGSSSSFGLASSDGYLSFSGHPAGLQQLHQNFGPPDTSNSHCHSGMITVFINGVATEVGRGPLDLKAMFGGDYALVHSSGVGVELNENGFLVHSLRHGESYFLVPRHS